MDRSRSSQFPSIPTSLFAALVILLVLLVFAPVAHAEGFYISAKYGDTDIQSAFDRDLRVAIDGETSSKGFALGYKILDFLAVEAAFHDLGTTASVDPCMECLAQGAGIAGLTVPVAVDTEAYSVAAVLEFELLPLLSIFGKAGFVRVDSTLSTDLPQSSTFLGETERDEALLGVGLRLRLIPSRLSAFAEWERLGGDIETVSLGVSLHF